MLTEFSIDLTELIQEVVANNEPNGVDKLLKRLKARSTRKEARKTVDTKEIGKIHSPDTIRGHIIDALVKDKYLGLPVLELKKMLVGEEKKSNGQ